MRFDHTDYSGKRTGPYTGEEAVAYQVEKEARLCDGALETANAKIEALQGILGRLIDTMPYRNGDDRENIARVIGHAWEPEN